MEDFINQLLIDQGVPSELDPETRRQLVDELTLRATDFLNQRLIDAMNDEVVEHFNKLLDDESTDQKQVQDFIMTNIPNQQQVVAKALLEFRAIYLGEKA